MLRRAFLMSSVAACSLATSASAQSLARRAVGASSPTPFILINGPSDGPLPPFYEGYSVTYTGTPSITDTAVAARQGFDASGNAITVNETFSVPQRVRLAFPNSGTFPSYTFEAHIAALNTCAYSTDVFVGAANKSTLISPKPLCKWASPRRRLLIPTDNIIRQEIVSYHRNARKGQEVACVVPRVSGLIGGVSTTHTYAAVSSTVVSAAYADPKAVIVTPIAVDTSIFDDNQVLTLDCKVYPWIGGAASVLDSAGQALKDLSTLYFLRNTTTAANPPRIYISTTGVDATAVVSTNDTLARAAPALTISGAMTKIQAFGAVDGLEVRLQAGTFALNGPSSGSLSQSCAAMVITRDPLVAQASAIMTFGSGASSIMNIKTGFATGITTGAMLITDVHITRTGNFAIRGDSGSTVRLELMLDNCPFDDGGFTSTWLASSDSYFAGVAFSNPGASGLLTGSAGGSHRLIRGVNVTNVGNVELNCVLGSIIAQASQFTANAGSFDGCFLGFNYMDAVLNGQGVVINTTQAVVVGMAIIQNVMVHTGSTASIFIGISNDLATNNTTNVGIHYNTIAGVYAAGRANQCYDDGTTARSNVLWSDKGNIYPLRGNKNDLFTSDGTRLGDWTLYNGTDCGPNFVLWVNDNFTNQSASPIFEGVGSKISVVAGAPLNPQFVNYTGTTTTHVVGGSDTYTAGTAGGDYHLSGGSPCKNMLTDACLSFDLDGTARPLTGDSAGAYL